MRSRNLLLAILFSCAASWVSPAVADQWPSPVTKVYRSPDARFTAIAAPFPRNGQSPRGILEQRGDDGQWRVVWQRPLVNAVAPREALVGDGGRYVVTFDNWAWLGWGEDVVVIYGAKGELVASLGLEDLLPKAFIETLPRSSSSIWWGGEHRFAESGRELLLQVATPGSRLPFRADHYFLIRVELSTGRSEIVRGFEWTRAMAESARVGAEQARAREIFEGPISAPAQDSRRAWQKYSWEIFLRLDTGWDGASREVLVLRLPPDEDYMTDINSIRGMLAFGGLPGRSWSAINVHRWQSPPSAFVFASPAPVALANALVKEAARLPAGVMSGVRAYVVCEPRDVGRIRMALGRLDADFIPIIPDQPIPQRPERLRPRPD